MKTDDNVLWEDITPTGATVTIKFRESELDDSGRILLDACRQQSSHLNAILSPREGVIHVDVWDPQDTDDVVVVRVQSSIKWGERMRQFGVSGLDRSNWDGKSVGPQGDPIPSEEYIASVERAYEGTMDKVVRLWEVPHDIIRQVRRGELNGAAAFNAIGLELVTFCQGGAFTVWRDPDWVGQTEAAQAVGVALSTISTAVHQGRLPTWTDPDETNPRRATRVRLSQVKRIWGK